MPSLSNVLSRRVGNVAPLLFSIGGRGASFIIGHPAFLFVFSSHFPLVKEFLKVKSNKLSVSKHK